MVRSWGDAGLGTLWSRFPLSPRFFCSFGVWFGFVLVIRRTKGLKGYV